MPRFRLACAASVGDATRLDPPQAASSTQAAASANIERQFVPTASIDGRLRKVSAQLLSQPDTSAIAHAARELAARRRDIVAARASDRRHDAGRAQSLPETVDRFRGGTLETGARERIERDQIDLRRPVAKQPDEPAGPGGAVVDTVEQHVLEGDLPAREPFGVAPAGVQELRDRMDAIDRHEPIAQLVGRRMQRHGERRVAVDRELQDLRHQARRADRDAPPRKPEREIVEQELRDRDDVAIVRERLAHAHEDHVRDLEGSDLAPRERDLADDLGDRKVTVEALPPGRAERAIERAAGLRGDAERAAVRLGNENGLDRLPRADVEQPLARAVRRALLADHPRRRELGDLREPLAELQAEIGHRAEIEHAALVDPAHDLARAIRLLTERDEELGELLGRQAEQVQLAAGNALDAQRVRGQMSASPKKKRISCAAVSGPSDPCTTFSSIEVAKSARIVPGAASFGFVAPIRSWFFWIAFSPSSTCTITGPEVMYWTRSLKNGRSRCTA